MLTICLSQELAAEGIVTCSLTPGSFKSRLGMPEAKREPSEVAGEFVEWFETVSESHNGKCFELGGGEIEW